MLGDYLKARRISLGMESLKNLSDATAVLGNKLSIESIRRYELGYNLPSVEALNVLSTALELQEDQKSQLLTLLAIEKLKGEFPTVPIVVLNEDLISIVTEGVCSTLRLLLERSGVDSSLSVDIQWEMMDECRKILKGLKGTEIPSM